MTPRFYVRDEGGQFLVERFSGGQRQRAAVIPRGHDPWEARARAQALAELLNQERDDR